MAIAIMRITHLRQADLNLLVVFTALAEERSVTRAASRLLLSQPAVSRALQRLREMFHDDLLIRTSSGYEQTPKGERLLRELATTLPRLDRLLSGDDFAPQEEETTFRDVLQIADSGRKTGRRDGHDLTQRYRRRGG
jgi:DNA-binding transcriptional LysR family regulator